MPILDQYGNPYPEEPKVATRVPARSASTGIGVWLSRARHWHSTPKPVWFRLVEILGILGFLVGLASFGLQFRQEIAVDPYISYSSSDDPFGQRFTITNNGPFAIYDVRYACAVTYVETRRTEDSSPWNNVTAVMIPAVAQIYALRWKEKTSTDCDFLVRYGPELMGVRIEIEVFYRRWPWPRECHGPGWKFSAKRDSNGRFIWDYGSPDRGLFEKSGNPIDLIPFSSDCCPFDPNLLYSDIKALVVLGHQSGRKVIVSTMLPCGRACKSTAAKN